MALGAHWATPPRTAWPEPSPATPLLVVSGSCSPVTAGQIDWALAHGFAGVAFDPAGDIASAQTAVGAALRAGRHTVVYTSRGTPHGAALAPQLLGRALGQLARDAIAQTGVKRLLLAGGDTSSYAARALGIEAVEMIAPLAPGAPLCRALAPGSPADGVEINFKGGQVGAADYFGAVALGRISP